MTYKGSKNHHGPSRNKITEATGDGNDLTVSESVEIVFGDTTSSVQTVTIPESAEVDGRSVTVVDAGGNAGTNAITVSAGSGNDVDGSNQDLTISSNFGELTLVYSSDESGWFTA